ncbi:MULTISPECIES: imm11 family protein [Cohnella]|uniref:imm11 family protein n=1 Tax=Cohnella TaxID=329857 RepID=UPI00111A0E0A|nr:MULTISPECIES: DUF1629 domain-containing protein [Cohnella]MBN2980382.1 hypothetical protein [Cohnella algarum]
MRIYELRSHYKSVPITSYNDESHPISSRFEGGSKLQSWSPILVETIVEESYNSEESYNDFPKYITGKPVVSSRVKEVIKLFVQEEVEFLPLMHEKLDLYMINVTNVLNCVNWERSDVKLTTKGKFAGFNKLVFDFGKIPASTYMFKIKETVRICVYVTEAFKNLIESQNLKGLDFSVVYDSEFTEEKELEQKRNYELALAEIERHKGEEFSYEEALERVDRGQAVASGKWKMQLDEKGRFWLGDLNLELKYSWIMPIYMPPVLLGYRWHEVEKSEI